jgi:hypothetical protein
MRFRLLEALTTSALVVLAGCCLQPSAESSSTGNGRSGGLMDGGAPDSGRRWPPGPCFKLQPQVVDFGNVVVNTTATQSVAVTNNCGIPLDVTIGGLRGTDPLLFNTNPAAGTVITLNDRETKSLTVQFMPLVASTIQSQAYFSLVLCGTGIDCEPLVSVRGTGVATGLAIDGSLNFGWVTPGTSGTKCLTWTNVGNATIHLTGDPAVLNQVGATLTAAGPFQPAPGFPTALTDLPPGQSVQLCVVFTPPSAGTYTGEIDISTDDPQSSNLKIPLQGASGGASISCAPTSLDFGLNAVSIISVLKVLCTNVGQNVPGHPEASLFIPDPNSTDQGLSLVYGDVAFQASFDQPFPAAGLAAGESTVIDVTYGPLSAGQDQDLLDIRSNDPVNPQTRIPVQGTAKVIPPCTFAIKPPNGLAFGHVDKGNTATLPFEIDNTGTVGCLVSDFQLEPGSSDAFGSFDPSYSATIAPGSSLLVGVTFAPTTYHANFSGAVTFDISDPTNPEQRVALTGNTL